MDIPRRRNGRIATYATLAALALALGIAAPAQAATSIQVAGDSAFKITATAKTGDTTLKKKESLHARATMKYQAMLLGIPLPATAYYMNSIPENVSQPKLDDWNASVTSKTYTKRYDKWLGTKQWIVFGSADFYGTKTVSIKGSAKAATRGSKYFHAGSGTGHPLDANAGLRITVK